MAGTKYSDHDLLITLNAKFDNLSIDVKTMGDGLSARVSTLETWRDQVDIYHAKIPLEKYGKLADSYERLVGNWKLFTPIFLIVGGIVVAVLSEVVKKFLHF